MGDASSLDSGPRQKVAGAGVAAIADGRHKEQKPCTTSATFSMAGALGCFKDASKTPNAESALWQATTPGQDLWNHLQTVLLPEASFDLRISMG